MIGYGEEEKKTTVLELTYNYGVTEYTKGNAYAQVMSHELFRCFFAYVQGIILVSMHICWEELLYQLACTTKTASIERISYVQKLFLSLEEGNGSFKVWSCQDACILELYET